MSSREDARAEKAKREAADAAESVAADIAAAESVAAEQAQKLAAEKDELKNALIRLQADFENYRKRIERERHLERHRGAEALVELLLPVLDAFDRALAAHHEEASEEYRKGFELIRKQLSDALVKQGLQRIETEGKAFDPHVHHAIERVESAKQPDGTILGEFQAGYSFHGKVLRPAMVRVSVQPSGEISESKSRAN